MEIETPARAETERSGDAAAQTFDELVASYRRELHVHCYRMLGSMQDAEDVLQEALLAAWRGIDRFEGRASHRVWLYQIATNRCLNALRDRRRRPRLALPRPPFDAPQPSRWNDTPWIEPYPDALLVDLADAEPGPEARYELHEALELAFIIALQQLPPRQRAVLVLKDVLGYRTDCVAQMLETSDTSVKGALQRARQNLQSLTVGDDAESAPAEGSQIERTLAARFADAFAADDIPTIISLLTEDTWLAMPPYPHCYVGPHAIARFLQASARWRDGRHYRLVPTRANMQPAFETYLDGPAGLIVLTLRGERIRAMTRFMDGWISRADPSHAAL